MHAYNFCAHIIALRYVFFVQDVNIDWTSGCDDVFISTSLLLGVFCCMYIISDWSFVISAFGGRADGKLQTL